MWIHSSLKCPPVRWRHSNEYLDGDIQTISESREGAPTKVPARENLNLGIISTRQCFSKQTAQFFPLILEPTSADATRASRSAHPLFLPPWGKYETFAKKKKRKKIKRAGCFVHCDFSMQHHPESEHFEEAAKLARTRCTPRQETESTVGCAAVNTERILSFGSLHEVAFFYFFYLFLCIQIRFGNETFFSFSLSLSLSPSLKEM